MCLAPLRATLAWAQQQGPYVGWTPVPRTPSPAASEVLVTGSSGNSTAATYPAVRDMAGTAEEDFIPSAG